MSDISLGAGAPDEVAKMGPVGCTAMSVTLPPCAACRRGDVSRQSSPGAVHEEPLITLLMVMMYVEL